MSNASLKEQLQALSAVSTPSTSGKPEMKPKKPNRPERNVSKPTKQKPVWLEHAQYGVELLKAYYPNCFKDMKDIQPLKIGIKQDLVKILSTREDSVVSDKAVMVSSLSYYVNAASYHKNMVAGAMRIDLDGNPAALVTAEEAKYSADCRKAKMQKRKPMPVPHTNKTAETTSS
jgi:sRNA-binding protein